MVTAKNYYNTKMKTNNNNHFYTNNNYYNSDSNTTNNTYINNKIEIIIRIIMIATHIRAFIIAVYKLFSHFIHLPRAHALISRKRLAQVPPFPVSSLALVPNSIGR